MYIIKKYPYSNGAYNALIHWDGSDVPQGYAVWPDELNTDDFYSCNGFVILTIDDNDVVTKYEKNTEKWEAWKETLPEPEPDPAPTENYVTYDNMAEMIKEGVNSVE